MMRAGILCLALLAAACVALPAQLEGEQDLIQVSGGSDDVPANMDEMQSMIDGAMKQTMKDDLGEDNAMSVKADMKQTMDEIAEKEAIADEMDMEAKRDCVLTQWTKWSKCNKDCGGGEVHRTRQIKVMSQNGGEQCPDEQGLNEAASCNVESCEDVKQNLAAESRHLTEVEKAKESQYNTRVMKRAMNANDVDTMSREMKHWMEMNVKTQMVNVLAKGEPEPTDEDEIQEALAKAMAKNSVDTAMAGFEEGQKEAEDAGAKKDEAEKKGDAGKQA